MQLFILTAQQSENNDGIVLDFVGSSDDGPVYFRYTEQRLVLFVAAGSNLSGLKFIEKRSLALKSFSGGEVEALYFKDLRSFLDARDRLNELGVRTFESDVRAYERFLMERFIHTSADIEAKNLNPGIRPSEYTPKLSALSLDIETGRGGELYSIGYHYRSELGAVRDARGVFMVRPNLSTQSEIVSEELTYFKSEGDVIRAFLKVNAQLDPDLIVGWHVIGFDLAFLQKKCDQFQIPFALGRNGANLQLTTRDDGAMFANLPGRVIIDGPLHLRSNFFSYPNFKLETVAQVELGVGKDISASGLDKVAEIEYRFKNDPEALAKYNLLDCTLVLDIFKKTKLIELLVSRSQISGLLLDRLASSTGAFDHIYLPRLHRKGYVAPNVIDIKRDSASQGGLVLSPQAGLHEHVIVLDFKSLYPSLMRTFFIDPLGRLEKEKHTVTTPTGHQFSRSENILAGILENLMERRARAKQSGNMPLSQAVKILMNSFYGVMGSTGCRFYHSELPEAITGTGQWMLRTSVEWLQKRGYEVLYGDTDSVFVALKSGEGLNAFSVGANLAKELNHFLSELITKRFAVESVLEIEFEKYYRKFFLPMARTGEGGAKKRYAGLLVHAKGEGDKLVFSGMEFVRSDWTALAKNFQYGLFERLFHAGDLEEYIRDYLERLRAGEFVGDLIYKKRLTKKASEYTKSQPPHVRAALMLDNPDAARDVEYVFTRRGPIPIELDHTDVDINHYIDKQLRPIAEGVLSLQGLRFDDFITGDQLNLF